MIDPKQSYPLLEAKTSVVQALKEIFQKELSGQLIIRSFNDPESGWRIYVGRGKVHYATSLVANQQRLDYLLSKFFPHLASASVHSSQEYESLCGFWRSGQLSFQQLRELIYTFSQEALRECS